MNTRTLALTAVAITVLVILGYAAQASPQLKEHATTIAIVVLAAMSISGILAALIAPFSHTNTVAHLQRSTAPTGLVGELAGASTGPRP